MQLCKCTEETQQMNLNISYSNKIQLNVIKLFIRNKVKFVDFFLYLNMVMNCDNFFLCFLFVVS